MSGTVRVCVLLLTASAAFGDSQDVKFYLFSQEHPNGLTESVPNDLYIEQDTQITILIHGWSENRTTKWYNPLKNALLAQPHKMTVIEVDYAKIATEGYPFAVRDSIKVGEEVGDFIVSLTKLGIPMDNIQIIGHSLGGQVAGYAGTHVFKATAKKLPKIVALDPAGPFFQGLFKLNKQSLSKDDAEIVYVVHTDRRLFGYSLACGTIDVFPNGGAGVQPGCPEDDDDLFCSHHRSYWFYIAALENPKTLMAVKCNSYRSFLNGQCDHGKKIDLAGDVTKKDEGRYYLKTSAIRPFRSLPEKSSK